MSVPAFNEFFPSVLQVLMNKQVLSLKEIREAIKKVVVLSEEDYEKLLTSGKQTIYGNRTGWAVAYLFKAGLLDRVSRGNYSLSNTGVEWIEKNGFNITLEEVMEFEGVKKFKEPTNKESLYEQNDTAQVVLTPEDQINVAFEKLNETLADDLLQSIFEMSPGFFEKLVLDLLFKMGYGGNRSDAVELTSLSHDGGIDGIINEDILGLDHVYVQAKRWKNPVHSPEIQKFIGALTGKGTSKGVFITTSSFSSGAQYIAKVNPMQKIILVDGDRLTKLMIQYGVGVSTEYEIKIQKLDKDYFVED